MPANLHGLNIVHPALSADRSDAHDLLSGPPFPDLSSQLDLWTTLSFDNEENVVTPRDDNSDSKPEDEEEERRSAVHDSHVNVVTGTVIPNHNQQQPHFQPPRIQQPQPGFDLNAFLASFGINPYSQPPPLPSQPQQLSNIPSLAQLLALHSNQQPIAPFNTPVPTSASTTAPSSSETSTPAPPPAKRTRTRKSSVSVPPAESPEDSSKGANDVSLSAAEDKRRRNTAASARFRLKKKEREAALESRAKELEVKVNELERECEGLRRENGWLKGLVVGVTGAQQQQQPQIPAGQKRGREDDS